MVIESIYCTIQKRTHTHTRAQASTNETNELNFVHDAQIKHGCAYAINNRLIRNGFQWMDTRHISQQQNCFSSSKNEIFTKIQKRMNGLNWNESFM